MNWKIFGRRRSCPNLSSILELACGGRGRQLKSTKILMKACLSVEIRTKQFSNAILECRQTGRQPLFPKRRNCAVRAKLLSSPDTRTSLALWPCASLQTVAPSFPRCDLGETASLLKLHRACSFHGFCFLWISVDYERYRLLLCDVVYYPRRLLRFRKSVLLPSTWVNSNAYKQWSKQEALPFLIKNDSC
jgi:hypothetical protein